MSNELVARTSAFIDRFDPVRIPKALKNRKRDDDATCTHESAEQTNNKNDSTQDSNKTTKQEEPSPHYQCYVPTSKTRTDLNSIKILNRCQSALINTTVKRRYLMQARIKETEETN